MEKFRAAYDQENKLLQQKLTEQEKQALHWQNQAKQLAEKNATLVQDQEKISIDKEVLAAA